jgi:hypothetical protein
MTGTCTVAKVTTMTGMIHDGAAQIILGGPITVRIMTVADHQGHSQEASRQEVTHQEVCVNTTRRATALRVPNVSIYIVNLDGSFTSWHNCLVASHFCIALYG